LGGKLTFLPASSPAPASSPTCAASEQSHNQEQQYRTDGRIHERADDSGTKVHACTREQPAADEGTNYSDEEVTDDPKASTTDDSTGEPTCYDAHEQNDQQVLI
jgi:hypothetical protein